MIDALVGRSLHRLRLKCRLSTREVANLLRITSADLLAFESGRARPTAIQLHEFALLYGIPIERLFADPPPPEPPIAAMPEDCSADLRNVVQDYHQRDALQRALSFSILTATAEP